MSILSTAFNSLRARVSPDYADYISREMLFEMPELGEKTAIILGATRATGVIIDALDATHSRFIVVGNKPVGEEPAMLTKLLEKSLSEAGIPLPPSPKMPEKEYGRYLLEEHFKIPAGNVITYGDDLSTNMQQNLEVLRDHDEHGGIAREIYSLAGTARRVLMTARKVWGEAGKNPILSAHNCYPAGFDTANWHHNLTASLYVMSEAEKVLSDHGPSLYEYKGYCVQVDIGHETRRAESHLNKKDGPEIGPR